MKREEKNQQTRRKIMDQALREFAENGYDHSSVNNIFDPELGISKGIIYHYFRSKEELFLSCVEETFAQLQQFIQRNLPAAQLPDDLHDAMAQYFSVRAVFFQEHPLYRAIFCEAVIAPPKGLNSEIEKRRESLRQANLTILEAMLSKVPLRPGLEQAELAALLLRLVSFLELPTDHGCPDITEYERRGQQLLDILVYGIISREENHNV